jgi:PAB1-binding protein PBP1|tara:strand:+ start:210 stop:470 length:261 start_codon:yes stop_codon:yes gene_type:complete
MANKLEEKELEKLQKSENDKLQIQSNLGFFNIQMEAINEQVSKAHEDYKNKVQEQQEILKEIEEKYGSITVNIQTGEYDKIEKKDE